MQGKEKEPCPCCDNCIRLQLEEHGGWQEKEEQEEEERSLILSIRGMTCGHVSSPSLPPGSCHCN